MAGSPAKSLLGEDENGSTSSDTLSDLQLLQSSRKDAEPSRMKAWKEATSKAKENIFDGLYGREYFQLQILATHPSWHRQGAATKLCNWGQTLAQVTGFSIAVFASPMGNLLYSHLGFKWLENVIIRAPNEIEHVGIAAMVYQPNMALLVDKD